MEEIGCTVCMWERYFFFPFTPLALRTKECYIVCLQQNGTHYFPVFNFFLSPFLLPPSLTPLLLPLPPPPPFLFQYSNDKRRKDREKKKKKKGERSTKKILQDIFLILLKSLSVKTFLKQYLLLFLIINFNFLKQNPLFMYTLCLLSPVGLGSLLEPHCP